MTTYSIAVCTENHDVSTPHNYSEAEVSDENTFESVDDAIEGVAMLRALGGDWNHGLYVVRDNETGEVVARDGQCPVR